MRAADFMLREVVNVQDGTLVGLVIDIELEPKSGVVQSLILEQEAKKRLFRFIRGDHELVVPWSSIVAFGDDVILVNYGSISDSMVK